MQPWLLDGGEREIDEWSAEPSPRLEPLFSRLRQANARFESTGLRPAPQSRTPLSYFMEPLALKLSLINESDRGAVVVAAALLEDDLDEILENLIQRNGVTPKHIKEMFALNGPLSSFSSKSLICYGFGLISKEIFDDLSQIRKLRNKLAHSPDRVDFLSSDIEDHVAEISCCEEASKNFEGKMFKGRENNPSLNKPDSPALEDWEMRGKGFVKYTKAVFCLGVELLRIKIKERHLRTMET